MGVRSRAFTERQKGRQKDTGRKKGAQRTTVLRTSLGRDKDDFAIVTIRWRIQAT